MAKVVFTILLLAIFVIASSFAAPSPRAFPAPEPVPQYYAYSAYPYYGYSGYAYPYAATGYSYYG